jgi:7-cyano-7-deazaguanine reductase
MSDTSQLTHLGSKSGASFSEPSRDILERFDFDHKRQDHVVGLDCYEFTSLCPMTGQPDFAQIYIAYVPDAQGIESKSLKLYLGSYRNHGSFHEDCINQIADDIFAVITPKYLRVFGDFTVRGGIAIKPLAVREAADSSMNDRTTYDRLLAAYDSTRRH